MPIGRETLLWLLRGLPDPEVGPVEHGAPVPGWPGGHSRMRGHQRHFYASGLIAAGCDVVRVQRALGHAKATTTLDTYSHLWPTAEDRTRQAATELWASAVSPNRPHRQRDSP
jgi:integrase